MKFPVLLTSALACLLPGLCHAAGDKPSQNYLWYRQPAVVQPAVLPWAQGESESGNLPGKASKDPWESQSLPVGNGRVGGTLFGGDKRERINLNRDYMRIPIPMLLVCCKFHSPSVLKHSNSIPRYRHCSLAGRNLIKRSYLVLNTPFTTSTRR